MIRYRQKEFIAPLVMPLLTAAGIGVTGVQMVKEGQDAKKNEEQLEEQNELIRKQNRELARIKKRAPKLGEAAEAATKTFGLPSMNTIKAIGLAAKQAFGKEALRNVGMGAAVAGTTYGAGKWIQHDMKKKGLEVDPNTGQLGQKQYGAASALKGLKGLKGMAGTAALGGAMGGLPVALGYAADKQQAKAMMEQTGQQQKQFGVWNVLGQAAKTFKAKGAAEAWKGLKEATPLLKHPGQTLSGTASNLASFGMGGTKNVQSFGRKIEALGSGKVKGFDKNDTLMKAGKWIQDHKTAANLISIAPGAAAAKVTWDGTQKVVDKTARKVDPGAYAYTDAKNKAIQQ